MVKSELELEGEYPVYQNSLTPLGYFDQYNQKGDTTFMICAGAAGEIGYSNVPYWSADDCFSIVPPKGILSKFIYHYLLNNHLYFKSQVRKASIPRLSSSVLNRFEIPVPPLELQEKIVSILDRFETLVNDLTEGLPAEIAASRERYEYYRNRLLSFKPSTEKI